MRVLPYMLCSAAPGQPRLSSAGLPALLLLQQLASMPDPASCLSNPATSTAPSSAVAGQLAAVGVVDVLPQYLSSVYLFWDPDLSHLALGKLSALWEIWWVQQAAALCPRLQYYCMGRALPPLTCRDAGIRQHGGNGMSVPGKCSCHA